MGGSPAGPDPGAITGLRRPDGSLAVTNAFDPNGTVTSRTDGTSSSTMRVDENGRVFERGDNRYFYGAMGDRTHVFDASKDRVIAQVGLLDIEYKRVGNALIRLRTEFIVPGGNVPLARVNESNNAVAFLHTDVQGSVAYVRGSTAGVDVRFDYTPFGEVLSARATGGASVERELRRFQGGLVDPSGAGYLQFGARLYDPVTQQWASADPAFHSYAYGFVGDSPYLRADPSGLRHTWMTGFVAQAGGFFRDAMRTYRNAIASAESAVEQSQTHWSRPLTAGIAEVARAQLAVPAAISRLATAMVGDPAPNYTRWSAARDGAVIALAVVPVGVEAWAGARAISAAAPPVVSEVAAIVPVAQQDAQLVSSMAARALVASEEGAATAAGGLSLNSSNLAMGVERASPELLAAVQRHGRTIQIVTEGSEGLRYLDYWRAEANVGGETMSDILLRPNPSKAAVLEEFLHGTQFRFGILRRLSEQAAETHVKSFMIRHRRMLGLGEADVAALRQLMEAGL